MGDTVEGKLTEAEKSVLVQLASAWNGFVDLDLHHPSDVDEFRHHLHALQNIVVVRSARRTNTDFLNPGTATMADAIETIKALPPYAWVIPGDDNAKCDGWLDARVTEEGEFTEPVYRLRDILAALAPPAQTGASHPMQDGCDSPTMCAVARQCLERRDRKACVDAVAFRPAGRRDDG